MLNNPSDNADMSNEKDVFILALSLWYLIKVTASKINSLMVYVFYNR